MLDAQGRNRYLVFDSAGRSIRNVQFSKGNRVVGFGVGEVYLIHQDLTGFETLIRVSLD